MTASEDEDNLLHQKLLALWTRAGRPSSRSLSRDIQASHTTIAETMNGSRVPSKPKYRELVKRLGGDWADFDELYPKTERTRTIVVQHHRPDVLEAILSELQAIRQVLENQQ